jgi:hypothetical protein
MHSEFRLDPSLFRFAQKLRELRGRRKQRDDFDFPLPDPAVRGSHAALRCSAQAGIALTLRASHEM